MEGGWTAMGMGLLIVLASMASVEVGVSVAIIEITFGILAGNFLGLASTPWVDYLASFASILLTFLAGAEVDPKVIWEKKKESALIGGVSFVGPFLGTILCCRYLLGWTWPAAEIGGLALSTTSLAVVYAVLVETGLTETPIGKLIMASTFVTDFGTALALSLLFIQPTWWLIPFLLVSAAIIVLMPRMHTWFFRRYGNRVIEPEIKGAFAALLVLMFFGVKAESHAVLPAFVLGLAVAHVFEKYKMQQHRFRVVAFSLLTPFFFIKSGMNISLAAVWANLGLLFLLLALKQVTKLAGVYPFARRYVRKDAIYTTLLMSTGLTFGTISSVYGYRAGLINQAQFSVLVVVVVLSAIVPTLVAQWFFSPERHLSLPEDRPRSGKPSDRATARERATVGEEA